MLQLGPSGSHLGMPLAKLYHVRSPITHPAPAATPPPRAIDPDQVGTALPGPPSRTEPYQERRERGSVQIPLRLIWTVVRIVLLIVLTLLATALELPGLLQGLWRSVPKAEPKPPKQECTCKCYCDGRPGVAEVPAPEEPATTAAAATPTPVLVGTAAIGPLPQIQADHDTSWTWTNWLIPITTAALAVGQLVVPANSPLRIGYREQALLE